jgi:hypothetical protein
MATELGEVDLTVWFPLRVDLFEIRPFSTYTDAAKCFSPSATVVFASQADARTNGKNLFRRRWIVGNLNNKSYPWRDEGGGMKDELNPFSIRSHLVVNCASAKKRGQSNFIFSPVFIA